MVIRKKGPNPNTIADGFSLTDEHEAVAPASPDFDYEDGANKNNSNNNMASYEPPGSYQTGMDHHLADPAHPKLLQSHQGEHRGDFGSMELKLTGYTKMMAMCAAINSCNLGYDIGVNTCAGPLVQKFMGLSNTHLEVFFGSLNFFAMVGAVCAPLISDRHGRRWGFIQAAMLFLCGNAILVTAQTFSALMAGRVFVGLGVGFGLAIDPVFISEIAPAAHRGELVTWSEIATNIGIVLGFSSGLIFSSIDDSIAWRCMFGLGSLLPLVMIFLAKCVLPESPRWLLQQKRESDARQVLEKIYPSGYNVSPIIQDMRDSLEREKQSQKLGWDMIIFPTPAVKRMIIVGVGIAIAQQAVGIDAIQYFLLYIIEESGIDSRFGQTVTLISLGLLKLIFIIIGGKLFDRKGRRPLLFMSLCGMATALMLLSINFFGTYHHSAFAIFGLAMYLSFFSLGMGPGAWLIPSEVFATCIRAKAMGLATFMNRLVATIMASTFLTVAQGMSWAGFFFMLALVCLVCLVFLHLYLPETKGRSLEDMTVYFAEITGDTSVLEADAKLIRDREAREHAIRTERKFEPINLTTSSRSLSARDARVVGTMS